MPRIGGLPEILQRSALERALDVAVKQGYMRLSGFIERCIGPNVLRHKAPRR
ncbi:MAG: hypothetical protein N838_06760 [Thiohalocapsa sp. PB-PSB1]|jgi:hypothetical protein|nr:MAG: hypothetical protein N838_01785 [Thiohalocapsa sp. PB-PSB1]QQO53110.1 MAG: hypothetical protein N838_06760 [Thiohalocapsa sp. PB-PSB1]